MCFETAASGGWVQGIGLVVIVEIGVACACVYARSCVMWQAPRAVHRAPWRPPCSWRPMNHRPCKSTPSRRTARRSLAIEYNRRNYPYRVHHHRYRDSKRRAKSTKCIPEQAVSEGLAHFFVPCIRQANIPSRSTPWSHEKGPTWAADRVPLRQPSFANETPDSTGVSECKATRLKFGIRFGFQMMLSI